MAGRARAQVRGNADPEFLKFVLFDVLAAIVVGVVAGVITGEPISSFLISLVVAVILLVVELRFQLGQAKETFAAALGMQREALEDPVLMQSLNQIMEGFSTVAASGDKYYKDMAQDTIAKCAADVAKLREGFTEIPIDDMMTQITRRLRETQQTVFATVLGRIGEFWFTGAGKEYLQENTNAVQRGVKVTRVFIVENMEELTPEVHDLIRAQAEAGFDVKIAFAHDLTHDVLYDMALFDEKYAWYLDLIPGTREARGAKVYRDPGELRKAKTIRDRILRECMTAKEFFERIPKPTAQEKTSEAVYR